MCGSSDDSIRSVTVRGVNAIILTAVADRCPMEVEEEGIVLRLRVLFTEGIDTPDLSVRCPKLDISHVPDMRIVAPLTGDQ